MLKKLLLGLGLLGVSAWAQIIQYPPAPVSGSVPGGAAGGDLSGTYPNPTVKASVSLTTPNINVAIGTSLALGGAAIGSNALAVTGTSLFTSTTFPVGRFTRSVTSALPDASASNDILYSNTAFSITDGSGPVFTFSIQGATTPASPTQIAAIGALRDGADNSGKLVFYTYNAGTSGIPATPALSIDHLKAVTVPGTLTLSSLTSGRLTYACTAGLLCDSANLTFVSNVLGITGTVTLGTNTRLNGGNGKWGFYETGDVTTVSNATWAWSNSTTTLTTPDTGLSRISAGLTGVGTGAQGSVAGSLSMTNATLSGTATAAGVISASTKFTISGCSAGTTVGGATAGKYSSGTTGACTVVITMNGATGITAPNGWSCHAADLTTPANLISQSASSTTTCTVTGTTVSGDVISFLAMAY